MTKRERVIAAIEKKDVDGIPSCFSLHFPHGNGRGESCVKAHLDFFRETDGDISKIMNENLVPPPATGRSDYPEAYDDIPSFDCSTPFVKAQLECTRRIIDASPSDSFFLGTLHGICASGIHPMMEAGVSYELSREIEIESLRKDEKRVLSAFHRIADGLCELVKGYKDAGVDAVYYAALGGEWRYLDKEDFDKWFRPFDIQIMKAIKESGLYCFLHICKDRLEMERYRGYEEYADVVNWGVYEAPYSLEDGRKLFPGKTVMGGLPSRHGLLVDGSDAEIRSGVKNIVESFGRKGFILGADCTLATEQDMHKLRLAIDTAREC